MRLPFMMKVTINSCLSYLSFEIWVSAEAKVALQLHVELYYWPALGSSPSSSCGPWVSVPCPWSPPSRHLAPSPAGPYCTPSPSGSCKMGPAKPLDTPRCARSLPSCRLSLTSCPGTGGAVQDNHSPRGCLRLSGPNLV